MLNIFFRCFSAILYSLGENSLFSSEPHFLMGLFALVKRILELHKGEVAVRSRAGEGSVFVVRVLTDGK